MYQEAPEALANLDVPVRHINADPQGNRPGREGNLVWIARSGHFIAQEAPEKFNAALSEVIAELDSSGQSR